MPNPFAILAAKAAAALNRAATWARIAAGVAADGPSVTYWSALKQSNAAQFDANRNIDRAIFERDYPDDYNAQNVDTDVDRFQPDLGAYV